MKRIVVFASGSGSNFQSILNALRDGTVQAQCAALICDRDGIGAIDKARSAGIPVHVVKRKAYASLDDYSSQLRSVLESVEPDLIVLAGYLSKIPDIVVARWRGKIINIHPALLPKFGGKGFYGLSVHQAVVDSGEVESGCTVHFVDEVYDHGSIIAQRRVPVLQGDTAEQLQQRVLEQEHALLPQVIHMLLNPTPHHGRP